MVAYVGVGLPVATDSMAGTPRPAVPALFVVGERDAFGPPDLLRDFVADSGKIVVIEGADHFFLGKLDALETAIETFLAELPAAMERI